MMTYKEYGKRCGITYEAVRQLCLTHAEELKGHIHKDGRARKIDDEGVSILDKARGGNPVVVLQVTRDEEIHRLQEENKALLLKVAALQDELLQERGKVAELQEAEVKRLQAAAEEQPRGFWARLFGKRARE